MRLGDVADAMETARGIGEDYIRFLAFDLVGQILAEKGMDAECAAAFRAEIRGRSGHGFQAASDLLAARPDDWLSRTHRYRNPLL